MSRIFDLIDALLATITCFEEFCDESLIFYVDIKSFLLVFCDCLVSRVCELLPPPVDFKPALVTTASPFLLVVSTLLTKQGVGYEKFARKGFIESSVTLEVFYSFEPVAAPFRAVSSLWPILVSYF